MSVHSILLEFDDLTLDRETFLSVFKQHVRPHINWEINLELALREITKNFYDHAYGKGVIRLLITDAHIEYEAYDFGPGYQEEHLTEFVQAQERTLRAGSSKQKSHNVGLGLPMIYASLQGIKGGHPDAIWSATIVDRFHYKGSYTSQAILEGLYSE